MSSSFPKPRSIPEGVSGSFSFTPGKRVLSSSMVSSSNSPWSINGESFPHRFRFFGLLILVHVLIVTYLVGMKQGQDKAIERAEQAFSHVYREFKDDPDHRDDIELASETFSMILRDRPYRESIKKP